MAYPLARGMGDLEANGENKPLMQSGANAYNSTESTTNPSAERTTDSMGYPINAASPECEAELPCEGIDRWLPLVAGKPFTHKLGGNISAGLTVALINIPLSLSLAVASDTSPQAGVRTAIWGGLFAAVFGGSEFNIQGPTGALSGILARFAIMFGPSCLPLLSLSSGLIMLLVFMLNWDRYVTFMPSSVAHGFTLGVAAIIAGNQIGAAFSLPPIAASPEFLENMAAYLAEMGQADWRAFGVFFSCWVALFACIKTWPRVPWMVPLASVGAALGWASTQGWIFRMRTLRDKYGELELSLWETPQVSQEMVANWSQLLSASMSIAFIGVLESLISGKIADGMTRTTMVPRQEVFAVAAANLAAGASGGIPATAALARTALNIRSGATSRLAGIFNAIFTLLIGVFALPLFGYLPLCVVAALLFQVAVGMVEVKHLSHAFTIDRTAFWLTIIVGALCLLFDPTVAIVIGAVVGLLRFAESVATGYSEVTLTRDLQHGNRLDLHAFDTLHHAREEEGIVMRLWHRLFGGGPSEEAAAKLALDRERSTPVSLRARTISGTGANGRVSSGPPAPSTFDDDTIIYRIVGDLTYISALHHVQRLRRLDSGKSLILSFRFCYYVDLDGLDALEECMLELQRSKPARTLLIASIAPQGMVDSLLHKSEWFEKEFVERGRVFRLVQDATNWLRDQAAVQAQVQAQAQQQPQQEEEQKSVHMRGRRLSIEGDI